MKIKHLKKKNENMNMWNVYNIFAKTDIQVNSKYI